MAALQTEFEFFLPKGFIDDSGVLHREGTMRMATARDELEPLRDPRVRDADDPFLTIIVLARVVSRLGSLSQVTPREVERFFAADLAYLQDVYGVINFGAPADVEELVADAETRRRESIESLRRPMASAQPVAAFDDENDDDDFDDGDDDEDDDTVSADALAAQLQARFGDNDNDSSEQPVRRRRRGVEEVGTRTG
jgi:hypothetical protein